MPKSVKDVLFPPLLPLFLRLAQRLANQNESSQRYEALRVAWNCLLRVAAILRGIRRDSRGVSPRRRRASPDASRHSPARGNRGEELRL